MILNVFDYPYDFAIRLLACEPDTLPKGVVLRPKRRSHGLVDYDDFGLRPIILGAEVTSLKDRNA